MGFKTTKNYLIMKTRNLLAVFIYAAAFSVSAQGYMTRTGHIKFFSHTPVEDIEAISNQVSSIIDTKTGSFAFLVPIKGFNFKKALMQEHFNENYMESSKYPNASFKGKIENFDLSKLSKDGEYEVSFSGTMNIHGIDRQVSENATFTVMDSRLSLKSIFNLLPRDYEVKIPRSKRDNISNVLEITVKMNYDKK